MEIGQQRGDLFGRRLDGDAALDAELIRLHGCQHKDNDEDGKQREADFLEHGNEEKWVGAGGRVTYRMRWSAMLVNIAVHISSSWFAKSTIGLNLLPLCQQKKPDKSAVSQ
ncbi:MAG: hypothetical protein ABIT83_14270 [Massilia sp.]